MTEPEDMPAMSSASDTNPSGNAAPLSETNSPPIEAPPIEEKDPEKLDLFDDNNSNNTWGPEDTIMPSASNTYPFGNAAPLSESNSPPIEEDDPIKVNLFKDNNNTSESTPTLTPKEDSEDSDQKGSVEKDERIMEAAGAISPVVGTSYVDAVRSNKPDIDVDTSVTAIHSQRIEPEGTTPVLPRAKLKFDDGVPDNVISESREIQEDREKERTNRARMPRIESEDVMTTQEENIKNSDGNNQDGLKKKPREPPGTPAKHERQTSETADEWQQRMKETSNRHQRELSLIDEKRLDQMLVDEGEEKKGDDEISTIQRDPSGSSVSLNKLPRDTSDQGNQPTKTFQDEEKAKEISTSEVEKEEKRYESPTRRPQQHGLDFNNTHIIHANSHAFNQPQTYNEIIRQTPNTLSPPNFSSEDDESIPIPHHPPLLVPGIGASYNSLSSIQGQSQQVHLSHNGYQQQYHQLPSLLSQQQQQPILPIPNHVTTMPGGKRKIHLHLWEDVGSKIQPETSGFLSFRRKKGILRRSPQQSSPISEFGGSNDNRSNDNTGNDKNSNDSNRWADRGTLAVSWYEGTNSLELQEHVQNSVIRKLGLINTTKLLDFRVLDESSDPPEEIVLSPYIPNGSKLIVRFAIKDGGDLTPPKYARFSDYSTGPPDSPSAAPSPYPASLNLNGLGLNANQLALLGTRLNTLQVPSNEKTDAKNRGKMKPKNGRKSQSSSKQTQSEKKSSKDSEDDEDTNSKASNFEVASLHPEDPEHQIQKSLREITGLLLRERGERKPYLPPQEKRQVIFVLANYFVLFLSLIAISAEIQARAPGWHTAMEQQLKNVHDCSKDKESLFTCVENGDMAGLVASVVLWLSRSASTKRIFLLGFGSSNKLWTAVYESLVTAICWGFSYMFIRRGMNPDNNRDFLRRYWKDAVYGSLAGFNAAFMKQVLKNLIPQEAIEDALQERQLKILSWLPSIG